MPTPTPLPTPPSSLSPPSAVRIPRPQQLPPSPTASLMARSTSSASSSSRCAPVLPLITSVFPYAASSVAMSSHMLEIVTPPDNVLKGFIADDTALGRCVFVHLRPTTGPVPEDPLAPHFSDVLRPHDPRRPHPVPPSRQTTALDLRESLTALLDLADTLEAAQLLLVLDKDERDPAPLAELLHALMYVGGTPVRPGALVGDWEWDSRRWALVSIEL